VLETLASFDLKQSDVRVYVFLAKNGPRTGKNLCNTLNMPKHQVYQCLRNLKNKSLVSAIPEHPTVFSAVSFEKVLDLLVKAKLEEVKRAQQASEKALSDWKHINNGESNNAHY
jgi:sugar-specific transcriptional regulator TrmB